MQNTKPKIGLALSGSSGRAIGHVAILEVFKEQGIPLDIVVGCSSGGVVAIAFGTGTLNVVKEWLLNFKWKNLWEMVSVRGSRGGLFHFNNKAANFVFGGVTKNKRFEDLSVKIGVTAADIQSGELVTITTGDLLLALKATIAMPGLFEPVVMNNRILVDGGLVNVVPTLPVKQLGADIVIGIDLARTKFIYQRKMWIWEAIRMVRRLIGIEFIQYEIIKPLKSKILEHLEVERSAVKKVPNMFRVHVWGADHSFDVEEEWSEEQRACDLMISPDVKDWSGKTGIKDTERVYEYCRRAALEAAPKIKQLITDFEAKQALKDAVHDYQRIK